MLQEKDADIVELLFELEQLVDQWKDKGTSGAQETSYFRVILMMLSHEYDAALVSTLDHDFRTSIYKLYSMLEDSGWKLTQAGTEHQQDLMDDELMQPPPSFNKY